MRRIIPRRGIAVELASTAAIVAAVWLYLGSTDTYGFIPVPEMIEAFRELWLFAHFASDFVPSLKRLALGYLVAAVIGVLAGFMIGLIPTFRLLTQPVISFMRSIPAVAILPLAIILLGIGSSMNVFIIAFACCWPIVLNTSDGVAELDSTLLATARSYSLSVYDRLVYVILPAVSPRIFTGLRTSLSLAVLLLAVSEMVAANSGIGFLLFQAQVGFRIGEMWAAILMLGLLGLVLNMLFQLLERRVLRWYLAAGTD